MFNVGDKVAYTRNFLQSTGWYTDVPDSGYVLEIKELGNSGTILAKVLWCDRLDPISVNVKNLLLTSKLHLEER